MEQPCFNFSETVALISPLSIRKEIQAIHRASPIDFSLSLPEETSYLLEGLVHEESSTEEKLPSTQLESINGLISSFRFMLEDEIAFALTQATPITQNILAKVIYLMFKLFCFGGP